MPHPYNVLFAGMRQVKRVLDRRNLRPQALQQGLELVSKSLACKSRGETTVGGVFVMSGLFIRFNPYLPTPAGSINGGMLSTPLLSKPLYLCNPQGHLN